MTVEFGVLIPTREAIMSGRPETGPLLTMAERAEAAGFDSVWIGDSITARPRHEPLTLMAAIAARTKRVRLGTGVLLPALRNPVVLAHLIATVDRISEGRVILGVGIAVELRERGDVVGLTLALGPKLPRLLQHCPPVGQVLRRWRRERVGEEGHGNPPLRHRALGIALQHLGERVVRGLVPERMLQLHRLVEGLLRLGRAGDREVDRAEHLMAGVLVGGARRHRGQA